MENINHVSYLIIGAGPAGLQLGDQLRQRGDRYLILEGAEKAGHFFEKFPRHRKLISINKVYTGYSDFDSRWRYDWNSLLNEDEDLQFTRYSEEYFPPADLLVDYLGDFAKKRGLEVRYNSQVTTVERGEDGLFQVGTADGASFTADRLVVATGLFEPNLPDIPGVELCESYDNFDMDLETFRDKRVLILGKGNSAFETADELIPITRKIQIAGPKYVRLSWVSHFVGDVRAVNNNFLDTYHLKGQNNVLDGDLVAVSRREDGAFDAKMWFESRQTHFTYVCDRIILCTGFRFDDSFFGESCKPELACSGRLPSMTCEWESTNVPNLFFAGTLMQMRDRKKTMSGFIHGFRHNIVALDDIFERRYRGGDWRHVDEVPREPHALAQALIGRASTSPGIFLQPGFLGDLVVVPPHDDEPVRIYRDMPVDYIQEHEAPKLDRYYVLTLEYGKCDGYHDPFAMPRGVGVPEDFYLHPILRRYDDGVETGKCILQDDLDNDWRLDPVNLQNFERWFEGELTVPPPMAAEAVELNSTT